ncbi:hypothetical protein RIF29_03553 [Crotalaria pallida]|uniref:Uncharacterized protein n=1 Tax=Crotalaria pallida TaxID=3830 RepID=A0AAN9P9D2_CROPI
MNRDHLRPSCHLCCRLAATEEVSTTVPPLPLKLRAHARSLSYWSRFCPAAPWAQLHRPLVQIRRHLLSSLRFASLPPWKTLPPLFVAVAAADRGQRLCS